MFNGGANVKMVHFHTILPTSVNNYYHHTITSIHFSLLFFSFIVIQVLVWSEKSQQQVLRPSYFANGLWQDHKKKTSITARITQEALVRRSVVEEEEQLVSLLCHHQNFFLRLCALVDDILLGWCCFSTHESVDWNSIDWNRTIGGTNFFQTFQINPVGLLPYFRAENSTSVFSYRATSPPQFLEFHFSCKGITPTTSRISFF